MNGLLYRAGRWLKTNGWRDIGLPFTIYILVAIVITWPLVTQLTTHVAGPEYADSFEYMRLGWWGKYALQHGLNPFYQSLFGYPEGFFSAVQWAQPLIYWPISLLGFIFSPAAAFNVWLLIEIALNGLAAHWLCRDVVRDSPHATIAGLFGGLIFMTYPAMQGHIVAGHVNPLANYGFPVLALCAYRIIDGRGGLRTALAGSIAILILALGNFTFPAFLMLPFVLFGGAYLLLFRRKTLLQRSILRNLLVMLVVGAALMIPFYAPLATDILSTSRPAYVDANGWVLYSTDLLSFIAPSPFNALLGPLKPDLSSVVLGTNIVEGNAYIGIVALILSIVAIWKRRKWAGLWVVIALGCMLFSLGPLLKVYNRAVTYKLGEAVDTNIVLPWALFQKLPFISATRTPGRFNMATGLAVGVLAAIGLDVVLQQARRRRWQLAQAFGLAGLALVESQAMVPFPTTPVAMPAYFQELAGRTDIRAVLNVPAESLFGQKTALNQQVVHQHPLIAGYVSRVTPIDTAKFSLLSEVALGRAYSPVPEMSPLSPDAVRTVLRNFSADVVVYHWFQLSKELPQQAAKRSFGLPAYTDNSITIHEVPPPQAPTDASAMSFSSTGWWQHAPAEPFWLIDTASVYLYAPVEQDRKWTLQFSPLFQQRHLQLAIDGQTVHLWEVNTPSQEITFWLHLTPGIHTLQFTTPEGCVIVPILPMCLLDGKTSDPKCQNKDMKQALCVSMMLDSLKAKESEDMALQPRNVHLAGGGTDWTLQGYRIPAQAHAGASLNVETNWQVTRKPAGDYHIFVHVLDQNGKLVAQYDSIPGGGLFPTVKWTDNQQWIESAHIALPTTLATGRYSLYTGWYAYPDLTRLKVDATTPHAEDGIVYLTDIEIK